MSTIESLRAQAQAAEKAGDWKSAARLHGQVVSDPTASFLDRHAHARATLYAGDLENAAELVHVLHRQNEREPLALMLVAEIAERKRDFETARRFWREARRSGATPYWTLYGEARAARMLGDNENARTLMDAALTLPEREENGIGFALKLPPQKTVRSHGLLARTVLQANAALAGFSMREMFSESLVRMRGGENLNESQNWIVQAQELHDRLASALEIHHNRFSVKRLSDFMSTFAHLDPPQPKIDGAAIVDLGSGSHNPLGLSFLLVMLGARHAFAFDLDPVQDIALAYRAMARSADVLLTDPARIVGRYGISRDAVARNISGFDLVEMRGGRDGIDRSKLALVQARAESLPVVSSSVDIVHSHSFLEHVEDVEAVLEEMARITVRGGFGVHSIDGRDHRTYVNAARQPLDFLRDAGPGMIHGCNRVRPLEFPQLFEKHGFTIQQVMPTARIPVDAALRNSFSQPWHDMDQETLETLAVTLVVRRC